MGFSLSHRGNRGCTIGFRRACLHRRFNCPNTVLYFHSPFCDLIYSGIAQRRAETAVNLDVTFSAKA